MCGQSYHQWQTEYNYKASSHEDSKVSDKFLDWLNDKYSNDNIREAKRRTKQYYLEMTLDNTTPGSLKLDMTEYVKSMVEEFQLFKAVMQPLELEPIQVW